MTEVDRYYQILEITHGATPEAIDQSYQDLSWIFRPDRFVGHPRLQKIAQQKLQEINNAHDQLTILRSLQISVTITAPISSTSPSYPQAYYPAYLPRYNTPTDRYCSTEAYSSPRHQDWQGSFEVVAREYQGAKQAKQKEVSTWLD